MNISSHVYLPTRWKKGQCQLDGSFYLNRFQHYSLTHWWPFDISNHTVFFLEKNAESLYGNLYMITTLAIGPLHNNDNISVNCALADTYSNPKPSNPFTYIIIK